MCQFCLFCVIDNFLTVCRIADTLKLGYLSNTTFRYILAPRGGEVGGLISDESVHVQSPKISLTHGTSIRNITLKFGLAIDRS